MDKRTIKIRELEAKLSRARDFILRVGDCAIDTANDGNQIGKRYWAKEAMREYAETKAR